MRSPSPQTLARSLCLTAFVLFAGLISRGADWALTGALGAHDPSIIKEGNTWWVFTTGQGLPVKFSNDGLSWTQGKAIFSAELSWWRTYAPNMGANDVWAPDIHKFNNRYWLYYSVSEFGKNNSAIGLMSCSSIAAGDWRDDGFVIGSKSGTDAYNAIDPNLTIDADGNPWLAFGSWFSGIQLVQLDPATMKPKGAVTTIAKRSNGIEGANVVYANGFYYLFISIDVCCQGVNSTYKIAYGRATTITGPYTDKNGTQLLSGGLTVLDSSGTRWKGPGGQDVYQTATGWIIARHAYDANANGAPTLLISDLYWDSQYWPTYTATAVTAPVINTDPVSQTVDAGGTATFTVTASSDASAPMSYQWSKNGTPIAGATSVTLTLANVQSSQAGDYTVAVTNFAGTTTSHPATLVVDHPVAGRLSNLSVLTRAGSGANTLIAGFIISGSGNKTVVVRGTGPTLAKAPFNVNGTLPDPKLDLTPLNATVPLATNDSWRNTPNLVAIQAVGLDKLGGTTMDDKDTLMIQSIAAGGYTASLLDTGGSSGMALVEVFDTDTTAPGSPGFDTQPRLSNLSARAQVTSGGGVLTAGFIINGTAPKRLMVRATGATLGLAPFNVGGVLSDPKLVLQRLSDSKIFAENDNWQIGNSLTEIAAVRGDKLGDTTVDPKDSIIIVSLVPGAYTATVSGVNNGSGVALIEVFELN